LTPPFAIAALLLAFSFTAAAESMLRYRHIIITLDALAFTSSAATLLRHAAAIAPQAC